MIKSSDNIWTTKDKIIKSIRILICLNINVFAKLVNFNKNTYKNTVVFIRMDNIGDFILWLKAAEEFSKAYHDKKKILICKSTMEEFAKGLNLWDEIIGIDWLSIKKDRNYRKNTIKKLSGLNAELLLNVQYSKSRMLEAIVAFISAKEKYTFDDQSSALSKIEKRANNTIYTNFFHIPVTVMELEKNIRFAEWVTGKKMDVALYCFPVRKVETYYFMRDKYFVLFPGGSYHTKSWDENRFAVLIKHIYAMTNLQCIVCGTKDEYKIGEKIKDDSLNILNFMGKTDLYSLIEIIRNAEFLIGNDTSGIHIAAAVRTPSIVIAGGWDAGRFVDYKTDGTKESIFYPHVVSNRQPCYGCGINGEVGSNCKIKTFTRKEEKFHCIERITVDMAIKMFQKFWENSITNEDKMKEEKSGN